MRIVMTSLAVLALVACGRPADTANDAKADGNGESDEQARNFQSFFHAARQAQRSNACRPLLNFNLKGGRAVYLAAAAGSGLSARRSNAVARERR